MKSLSRVRLFATPWTVAYQAPLSMRFSRQGYWNGLPFPSPGDLPNPGIEPKCPALQADSLPTKLQGNIVTIRWFINGKRFKCMFYIHIVSVSHSVMLTLCDPMDCSLPDSSVHEIFQARILEWVAISFFKGSSQPRGRTLVTCTAGRFFLTELQGKPM